MSGGSPTQNMEHIVKTRILPKVAAALLACATNGAIACEWFDPLGICGAAETASKNAVGPLIQEIEELRKSALQAVNTVTLAVPGERYLRIIDDLNGADETKREAAKAFLKNLAHIDVDTAYELGVAFDFDETVPFHVDFNTFVYPEPQVLQAFVTNSAVLDTSPARTILSPLTPSEVHQRLTELAGAVISAMQGANPPAVAHDARCRPPNDDRDYYCVQYSYPDNLFVDRVFQSGNMGQASFDEMRAKAGEGNLAVPRAQEARSALVALFEEAFSYRETRMDNPGRTKDWPLISGKNFVVFFIDQVTFDTHTEDWQIKFNVHQKEHPDVLLYQRPGQTVTRADFDLNPPLKSRDGRSKVYWAFREMTGEFTPSASDLEQLLAVRETLEKYKQVPAEIAR